MNCNDELLVEILSCFGIHYQDLHQTQLYKLLSTFVTNLENRSKPIQSDALRVWIQTRITQIKKTLFNHVPSKQKNTLDPYFEWLVYKLYQRN